MTIEEIIALQVEATLNPRFTELALAISNVQTKVDSINTADIMTKLLELEAILEDIQVQLTTTACDSCDDAKVGIQSLLDKQALVITALKDIGATLVALGGEPTVQPTETHAMIGFNAAGLSNNPGFNPGELGTHFRTIAPRGTQPDYMAMYAGHLLEGQKFLMRVPYSLERVAQKVGGVISLMPDYVAMIREVIQLAAANKGTCLIDMHSYCRLWVPTPETPYPNFKRTIQTVNGVTIDVQWIPIGHALCPYNYDDLAEIYRLIALEFKDEPGLWGYGLMNEPHNAGGTYDDGINVDEDWIDNCDKLRAAIRTVDTEHWVTIAGCAFSTAKNWRAESGRLAQTVDLTDPKIMFEAHQYCDENGGGGGRWRKGIVHTVDPVARANDWDDALLWGTEVGIPFVAGEFGGPIEYEKWTADSGGTFEYNYVVEGMAEYFQNLYAKFAVSRVPSFQWLAGPGDSDTYANGMDRNDGTLKPNANELYARIGSTVEAYGQ